MITLSEIPTLEIITFTAGDNVRSEQALGVLEIAFPKLAESGRAEVIFKHVLHQKGTLGFLALNAAEMPLGMALVDINTKELHGTSEAELRYFGVAPPRRQGIGRFLLSEIQQTAKQSNKARLSLDSSVMGLPFYSSMGYVRVNPANRNMYKIL